MRLSLLYNPAELIVRLSQGISRRRTLGVFKGTPAADLSMGYLGGVNLLMAMKGKPIKTIADIGANTGTWSRMARSVFPNARIDAFEPIPGVQKQLKATAVELGNVFVHAIALGSKPGQAKMNTCGIDSDCSSVLSPSISGLSLMSTTVAGQVDVPIERLDDVISRGDAKIPDFIKMDVQGFELEVLRGAENCLKHAAAVQCEISFQSYYKGQASPGNIFSFMDNHGYQPYLFDNFDQTKPLSQLDALFLKKIK